PQRDASNRYFDLDHVPQRLSCPGFLAAERYELAPARLPGAANQPFRYLNFYYLAAPEVLASAAYARQFSSRSLWTQRAAPAVVGATLRGVWVERPSPWMHNFEPRLASGPTTLLMLLEDAVEPGAAVLGELNRLLDEEIVPGWLSCPGFLSCRRYESGAVDVPGPNPLPAPRFMTLYQLAAPETVTTQAFQDALGWAAAQRGATQAQSTLRWQGVYAQRPSPWTVQPVALAASPAPAVTSSQAAARA
ncbi:MAG: hypothetical protein ACRDGF_08020, partial [Chloroflexota bacterium]